MKKLTNTKPYKYDVFVKERNYSINPLASSIFEDEVALGFMKYFPTVLKIEDYIKPQEVQEIKVEIPKVEVEKEEIKVVVKKVKKISDKTLPKSKLKKSKK